jgi:PKD repeat protein
MKRIILLASLVLAALAGVLMVACESHKDPFSANNQQPVIADFRFKPDPNLPNIGTDSLKIKSGTNYLLHLQYDDREFSNSTDRKLQARFSFESGGGRISHDEFGRPTADGLTFNEAPGKFNGDLLFTPAGPGLVRLQLQLSDGVKVSETIQTSVTFFENLKPTPRFTVRLINQTNPYEVEFNPESSQDRDGDITKTKFIWNFGDNTKVDTVLGRSIITHKYAISGQYRVRLRAIDEEGKADSTEQLVTTSNQQPRASLQITPRSGQVPLEIDYTTTGSFDPDGTISSYQILFGDGDNSPNPAGKHIFRTDGNYQVVAIVKDHLGLADTATATVSVSTPPVAALKMNPESGGPIPLRLMVSGKDSYDPHPGGGITAYRITLTNLSTNAEQVFPQDSITTLLTAPAYYRISLSVTNNRNLTKVTEKVIPAGLPTVLSRNARRDE